MNATFIAIVGNDPTERSINAASAKEAAEKAVRQWRGERSFFANESQMPAVVVDGIEFTPAAYATTETSVYDA